MTYPPSILQGLSLSLIALFGLSPLHSSGQDKGVTKKMRYLEVPPRSLTVYYPDNWSTTDRRPALVIFRCNIPAQREYFRKLGMVVIKPQTAPVNSGQLPGMSLEEIAASPKPRDQVADTKSAIRFIRNNATTLGIDPEKIVATGTSGGGDLALQSHLNRSFTHKQDDLAVSCSPDILVLYCPAFDGIDLWFVKTEDFLNATRASSPAFIPYLDRFIANTGDSYARPIDHRKTLIELADTIGIQNNISKAEIESFQNTLELFNERDWQLLHPAEDALEMSATRILTKSSRLPPTQILIGDRDHLAKAQQAFLEHARNQGQAFDLKVYKGGGHSFMTQPAFESTSTEDVHSFLKQHKILPVDP